MPYLKLGSSNINYVKEVEDKLILSSIVNSSSSYQYPVLVRDSSTLDIYFGKNFDDRNYFEELLNKGATLYLYRPIDTEKHINEKDSNVDSDIPLDIDSLEIPENSSSWYNRDTLRLIDTNLTIGQNLNFEYCYPEYGKEYKYKDIDPVSMSSIDVNELSYDYDTLSFILDFSNVSSFSPPDLKGNAYYITLPVNGRNVLMWFKYSKNVYIPPIGGDFIGSSTITIETYGDDGKQLKKDKILDIIIESLKNPYVENTRSKENTGFGYDIEIIEGTNKNRIRIWRYYQEPNTKFYDLPGLTIESDFRKNHDILSEISELSKRIEFYSKTIGTNDEDIKISIEKINYSDNYRVIISRFDYEEVYEVSIFEGSDSIGIIDSVINRNSKLVRCNLIKQITYNGETITLKSDLPTGTWNLKGSTKENYTKDKYIKSLRVLKDLEVFDDFFLIDNIQDWMDDSDYKLIYNEIFSYNNEKDNQSLISNRGNNYKWNKTDDINNRLVYFYGDIKYGYNLRPAYYVFLEGLLTDIYSVEVRKIRYDSPDSSILSDLDKYKSNYLLNNNLFYYYYDYKNHNGNWKFNTSIVTRFIISKVGRTIKNNKWNIIDKQSYNDKERFISSLLDTLKGRYSIIKSLTIESLVEDLPNYKLDINIKLMVGELLDKDVTINITLNYIK